MIIEEKQLINLINKKVNEAIKRQAYNKKVKRIVEDVMSHIYDDGENEYLSGLDVDNAVDTDYIEESYDPTEEEKQLSWSEFDHNKYRQNDNFTTRANNDVYLAKTGRGGNRIANANIYDNPSVDKTFGNIDDDLMEESIKRAVNKTLRRLF